MSDLKDVIAYDLKGDAMLCAKKQSESEANRQGAVWASRSDVGYVTVEESSPAPSRRTYR